MFLRSLMFLWAYCVVSAIIGEIKSATYWGTIWWVALYIKTFFGFPAYLSKIAIHIPRPRPVSTKLGQNIYVQQNLNEFDHGSDWTGTTGVICSWIGKNCYIQLCLLPSIYKYKPISTKLGHNEYEHRSQMSLIMGQVTPDQWVLSALEIEK